MKVFISWSGETSKAVAETLHDWIPNVIQAVKPWISSENIDKGARWSADMAKQLGETRVGVICLTPDNLEEPWILFEAGALSKTLEQTYVCPYLFGVKPSNLKGPLVQFQATNANKTDTQKLVLTINKALGEKALDNKQLEESFETWWPRLKEKLDSIGTPKTKPTQRGDREILEEILAGVRGLLRNQGQLGTKFPRFGKRDEGALIKVIDLLTSDQKVFINALRRELEAKKSK